MTVGLKARQTRNKFKAVATKEDGYRFLSLLELRRYRDLKLMQRAGEIQDLEVHPRYPIIWPGTDTKICVVELDFQYRDSRGTLRVEDTKGLDNILSKMKRKLVEAAYGFTVELVTK
jgi:hypothetical protein